MKTRGRPRHPETLTPRQQEVLALLRQGLTNEEIAARLGITLDGAKFHVSEILLRLGVDSRYEAATWSPDAEPARGRWAFVLAPLALPRKLRWSAAGAVAAMTLVVAVAAGIALLTFGLVRTNEDRAAARIGAADPAQVIFSTLAAGEVSGQHNRWTITVYDTAAKRIVHQFDIGDGKIDQPTQVVAAGDKLVANLSDRIVRYNLDGSNPIELRHAAPGVSNDFGGPRIIGIGASPDGTKIALAEQTTSPCPTPVPGSEATPVICNDYASITRIVVITTTDGRELMSVPQSAPGFAGYKGQAALPVWRADDRSFLVSAQTYSEAPGNVATVFLDGTVQVDGGQSGLPSPDGTLMAGGESQQCSLGTPAEQHEIIVRRIDNGKVIASLREPKLNFDVQEWSPDSEMLLYRTFAFEPLGTEPDPGCPPEDPSSVHWYELPFDGAAPIAVADIRAARESWYGNRTVAFGCGDAPPSLVQSCSNANGTDAPVSVYIGGNKVATGANQDFRLIQQIPPAAGG